MNNKFELSNEYALVRVLSVKHYTNNLFSFEIARPKKLRFKPGEFIMIGLIIRGELVFRAYSICSPTWSNTLEFYSVKVPNGLFTTFLHKITTKSSVIIKMKPTGNLILETLRPGKRLFLLCTGTGVSPFVSIVFNHETYIKYDEVIVVLTCRYSQDLQFFNNKLKQLTKVSYIRPYTKNKLRFYLSVTRELYPYIGRITWLIKSGRIITDLMTYNFNKMDRFMICGSRQMVFNVTKLLKKLGYNRGAINNPQDFVYEKAYISHFKGKN
ncbi:Ferredoxin--NADP reductase [Candidatus Hodgkinia cicadicola]|uniref:ferredoxin--NADP(+) reductase n=1 Tax=Candidatus Hodgkinia cicadicola TaxID=573658 RepID=A0ABX4MF27_9HYPH|nr:Ferredoxin--NADP reductase [Candidatus Hodgkinia cicadicola]PIM96886.1 Ferredoxin--NADP reductase [Candidatus Hodgkinia cicadicola]